MIGDGEPLQGGVANAGRVTRIGDLVRRPSSPNAVVIHALLEHLAANVGFDASRPQSLGRDGFELQSYLPGNVPIAPFPPWVTSSTPCAGRWPRSPLPRRRRELRAAPR